MSFYKRIKALGLSDETNVNLVLEEGCDVHHYTDDYLSNAMAITGIAHTLAETITEGPLYESGSDILQEMRDEGLLDDYERGSDDFTSFVAEVIEDNHWDYDWFEHETTRYDYKRGHTTFTLEFDVPAKDLKNHPFAFQNWVASVQTENGTLTLGS
jgi:hypothetical protein